MRVTPFIVALQLILTPFFAFGAPCASAVPCVVSMPEHWGVFEYIGYFALSSVVFWVIARLRILRLNHL